MPDQKDTKMQLAVSAEEAEAIKSAAAQQGISVSQYLHARVFEGHSPPLSTPGDGVEWMGKFEGLLRHLVYITNRIHCATFSIPAAANVLTEDRLQQIYDETAEEGRRYLAALPEHIAKTQARITAPPAGEKGAA